ncbi:glycoside hydrolase family 16 protein [Akkermansiaceae bacterium]|nr:glycoside hydrolase family 16 protein [Akkermansiaceae bacterium]
MHTLFTSLAVLSFLTLISTLQAQQKSTHNSKSEPSDWELVWSDEFDGDKIDSTKWDFDTSNGFFTKDTKQWVSGWGNNELQYYTSNKENAYVKDGFLNIVALKESLHNCGYTSARLKTRKKDGTALFAKAYGKFDFRAKLPLGQGLWPALWLLPQEESYGTWAASGEIDVLEATGQEPQKVHGTLHYGSKWPANAHSGETHIFKEGTTIADFHNYSIGWEPGEIRWYVDNTLYSTQNSWWSSSKVEADSKNGAGVKPTKKSELNPWPAPFNKPFYILMNLAVGGHLVGAPNENTPFPSTMQIDYVRVYTQKSPPKSTKPRTNKNLPLSQN